MQTSFSDPDPDWIRIQVVFWIRIRNPLDPYSESSGSVFGIRIQGLKKGQNCQIITT